VFAATEAVLAAKNPASISFAEVAERAGVAQTSLYRRWGEVGTLLMDVAVEALMRDWPLPDTGSLKGDLTAWATAIAASLSSREGSTFFRVYVATPPLPGEDGAARATIVMRRVEQIRVMLDRANARGEKAPTVFQVTDYLLAPLYMRVLFGASPNARVARDLVDRLVNIAEHRTD
jgi:AcrR family transcriptional regulator